MFSPNSRLHPASYTQLIGNASISRRVAIAVPARNESGRLDACLHRLVELPPDRRVGRVSIVVLANNCDDDTYQRAKAISHALSDAMEVRDIELPPERAHAGWARRLALEAAAEHLREPDDVIMSTDADTVVATDWLSRTLDHLDRGYDAIAGVARLSACELRLLPRAHRLRLARIRRYENALAFLKAVREGEPWPRHFYEGGASIAMTLRAYQATGGAPTPRVGEDKALFDAVRRVGGRIRHPMDVRVQTSARLCGRAPGGASDTLALWGRQLDDEKIHGLDTISATLGTGCSARACLTFRNLHEETTRARVLVRAARQAGALAESA